MEATEEPKKGFLQRLKAGLSKTRQLFVKRLDALLFGRKVDEALLEELEELLITADFGLQTTRRILDETTQRLKKNHQDDGNALRDTLKQVICDHMLTHQGHFKPVQPTPHVILIVGVNGTGKTTTIGKLAAQFVKNGHKVMLAAGDTFRAAAIEQLKIWGGRVNCPVIAQSQDSDSASVIFDAHTAARARGMDVLLVDTAGRLHTKSNLMEELKKIRRVLSRQDPASPHDVWLVLDATTGQNAVNQTRQFHEAMGLTGLILTKLDGTAKGGVVVGISEQFNLPIRYIGVGEGLEDLRPFDANLFVEALFSQ